MNRLVADAGYDAEWIHQTSRLVFETRTIIPAKIGRPTDKPPVGFYRRRMARHLDRTRYGQRAQAETVFSVVKRRLDASVNACPNWSQCRALILKAIAHNIMILKRPAGFRQSQNVSFFVQRTSRIFPRI